MGMLFDCWQFNNSKQIMQGFSSRSFLVLHVSFHYCQSYYFFFAISSCSWNCALFCSNMLLLVCFIFTLPNFLNRSQLAFNSWYASCYACCAFCFDLRVLSPFCRREIIVLTIWRWGRTWTIATVTVAAVTRWARRRRTWRCARVAFIAIVNRLLLDFGEIQRGWITF